MEMSSPLRGALRHAVARAVRRVTLYWGLDAWPSGALSRSPAWRYRSVRPAVPRWQVPDTRT